jgi:hypothetical protein
MAIEMTSSTGSDQIEPISDSADVSKAEMNARALKRIARRRANENAEAKCAGYCEVTLTAIIRRRTAIRLQRNEERQLREAAKTSRTSENRRTSRGRTWAR